MMAWQMKAENHKQLSITVNPAAKYYTLRTTEELEEWLTIHNPKTEQLLCTLTYRELRAFCVNIQIGLALEDCPND